MKTINKETLCRRLTERQNGLMESGHVGRCEIIVRQEGEKIFHESFGCEKNLMYRLASMTKPITTAAVLSEVQQGRLSLKDKVSKYFKSFSDKYVGMLDASRKPIPKEKAKIDMTVERLLNHTNGILSDIDGVGNVLETSMTEADRQSLKTVTDYLERNLLFSFQPGEMAFYSATGAFDVAARIVELTSGMAFDTYINKYLLEPMGIRDITFTPTEEQWNRMSMMHMLEGGKVSYHGTGRTIFEGFPLTYFCGGAGMAGTAEAYSEFAEMLLNEGRFGTTEVLKPEMVRLMKTPYVSTSGNSDDAQWWGLGVRVIVNDYILPKGCFGWSGAYGSHFWVDPENHITAVYMKNSRYDGGAGAQSSLMFEEDVVASLE